MKKQIWIIVIAVLGTLVLAAGCGGASGDPEAGKAIYETGGSAGVPCNTCHTLDGSELVGPTFQGISTRAGSRKEGMSAQDYIRESIKDPSAYIVENFTDQMPAVFGQALTDDEISNLIAFLMTQ